MKWFRILGVLLALAVGPRAQAQTATVTWTTTFQSMDGFGGQDWHSAQNLTSAQADLFFSPTAGIGLEILRTGNYGCPSTGGCTVATSSVPDLTTRQEAVARGAIIWESIQSPPANLKYNNSFTAGTAGANGTCIPNSNWSAYASYIVSWIQMLNSNGSPVSILSVSNEADIPNSNSLGACQWTASALDSFIGGILGPALSSAGLSSIKLSISDDSSFGADLFSTCLANPTCAQYVSIVAWHGYGTEAYFNTGYCCLAAPSPPANSSGKHLWQSEINGGFTYDSGAGLWTFDASMADALVWARNIHDYLTVTGVSGWHYWELADCCSGPYNDGLTDGNFDPAKRLYVVGNWSKFVRHGWVRIDATSNPVSGVYVTAFNLASSNSFAIVAVNTESSNTAVTFSLSEFPTSPSFVTPWITSSTLSLTQQSNVSVSDGSFTYTLPAQSITSFVGNTTTATAPAPPTQVTARVQ